MGLNRKKQKDSPPQDPVAVSPLAWGCTSRPRFTKSIKISSNSITIRKLTTGKWAAHPSLQESWPIAGTSSRGQHTWSLKSYFTHRSTRSRAILKGLGNSMIKWLSKNAITFSQKLIRSRREWIRRMFRSSREIWKIRTAQRMFAMTHLMSKIKSG